MPPVSSRFHGQSDRPDPLTPPFRSAVPPGPELATDVLGAYKYGSRERGELLFTFAWSNRILTSSSLMRVVSSSIVSQTLTLCCDNFALDRGQAFRQFSLHIRRGGASPGRAKQGLPPPAAESFLRVFLEA